jgi:hypothetical protein
MCSAGSALQLLAQHIPPNICHYVATVVLACLFAGLLQDSGTQLTCCGSAAAGQDVVVTLEALVKQLPPTTSTDEAAATAAGSSTAVAAIDSISSACWQAAVQQMQRETPVLGSKQQVRPHSLRCLAAGSSLAGSSCTMLGAPAQRVI